MRRHKTIFSNGDAAGIKSVMLNYGEITGLQKLS